MKRKVMIVAFLVLQNQGVNKNKKTERLKKPKQIIVKTSIPIADFNCHDDIPAIVSMPNSSHEGLLSGT